jgi:adenine nucleotide transporter 17
MSDSIVHAIAGAGGGILSMALTYPLITLSTRSQVDSKTKISQLEALKQIIKQEGTKGLYSY